MGQVVSRSRFFEIEMALLGKVDSVFPFTLFILEKGSGRHAPFLYANSPYSLEVQNKLGELISKEFGLSLSLNEKDHFLKFVNKTAKDIPSLAQEKNEWELLWEGRKEKYQQGVEESYPFVDQFRSAMLNDDFNSIIARTKLEILQFPYSISSTVSNAVNIADKLLKPDDETSKIISCCFQFSKKMQYKDEESLAAMVCAAAFRDIGSTQLNQNILGRSSELFDLDLREWEKHPALSIFLLKKGGIDLSERVYRIILEHHERFDGTGFPRQKKAEFIDPMAELLGLFEHLFHFSYGKINGQNLGLARTFKAIIAKHQIDGLDYRFSPALCSLIESYLPDLA